MARLALLTPLVALLGGCIIYDTKCPGCGMDDDSGRPDRDHDDDGDDDTATDDTGDDDVVEATFVLDPSEAAPGESFIGSLTAVDAFDYATVASVEVFGDVAHGATNVRDDEILLSLEVAADGAGTVDILVQLTDGSVEFVEGALTIVAADGSGDGSDDGSGGSDDGTGGGTDDGTGGSDDCP